MATYTATRIVIASTTATKLGNLIFDALVHDSSVEVVKLRERGVLELRAWTGPRGDDSNVADADPAADY